MLQFTGRPRFPQLKLHWAGALLPATIAVHSALVLRVLRDIHNFRSGDFRSGNSINPRLTRIIVINTRSWVGWVGYDDRSG